MSALSVLLVVLEVLAELVVLILLVFLVITYSPWRRCPKLLTWNMLHCVEQTLGAWRTAKDKLADNGIVLEDVFGRPEVAEAETHRRKRSIGALKYLLDSIFYDAVCLQEVHPAILDEVIRVLNERGYSTFATKVADIEYVVVATKNTSYSWVFTHAFMKMAVAIRFSFSHGVQVFASVHVPFGDAVIQAGGGEKKLLKWVEAFDALTFWGLIPTYIGGDFNTTDKYFPEGHYGKLISAERPSSFGMPVSVRPIGPTEFHRCQLDYLNGSRDDGRSIDGVWTSVQSGRVMTYERTQTPFHLHIKMLKFILGDDDESILNDDNGDPPVEKFVKFLLDRLKNGSPSDHHPMVYE